MDTEACIKKGVTDFCQFKEFVGIKNIYLPIHKVWTTLIGGRREDFLKIIEKVGVGGGRGVKISL